MRVTFFSNFWMEFWDNYEKLFEQRNLNKGTAIYYVNDWGQKSLTESYIQRKKTSHIFWQLRGGDQRSLKYVWHNKWMSRGHCPLSERKHHDLKHLKRLKLKVFRQVFGGKISGKNEKFMQSNLRAQQRRLCTRFCTFSWKKACEMTIHLSKLQTFIGFVQNSPPSPNLLPPEKLSHKFNRNNLKTLFNLHSKRI